MSNLFNSQLPITANTDVGWDSERIFSDASVYFESLITDIENASSSIAMAVYIFSTDVMGLRIVKALELAALRGVKVRLLIDGVGSAKTSKLIAEQLSLAGAQVRIFHPVPWYWDSYRWSLRSGNALNKLAFFVASLNQRDHRKICIVDDVWAWCGSFNITDDHLNTNSPWRDYATRVTGKPVRKLTANFDGVWFHQKSKVLRSSLRYFLSNNSMQLRRMHNRLLVNRISNAHSRVWICSAYFSPSGAVIKAIKKACSNGVNVKLIVSARSDVTLFPLLSSTYYADLLNMGVSIYCYQAGMLHAKSMLIDQRCIIGSTNLNHRSFYHDLELDLVLSSSKSIGKMESLMRQDITNSIKLNVADVSFWSGLTPFGWILRILRYWL